MKPEVSSPKFVLIVENIVVRGATRTEETAMALQIPVELRGVGNYLVDHSACKAISALILFTRS